MEQAGEGLARLEAELRAEKAAALGRIAAVLEGILAELKQRREDFDRLPHDLRPRAAEAYDYFQQTYGGRMVHLLGSMDVVTCGEGWRGLVSPDAVAENGLSVPAGLVEQSGLLFLRPDLVPPAFLKILDRRPGPTSPRYSDEIVKNPVVAAVVADSLAGDRALEARQEAWLKKQSPWPAGPRW